MIRMINLAKPPRMKGEIGAVLKKIRKENKVSQVQLAAAMCVDQSVVSRAETGEVLTFETLDDIGYCLGFNTPQEFFLEVARRLQATP